MTPTTYSAWSASLASRDLEDTLSLPPLPEEDQFTTTSPGDVVRNLPVARVYLCPECLGDERDDLHTCDWCEGHTAVTEAVHAAWKRAHQPTPPLNRTLLRRAFALMRSAGWPFGAGRVGEGRDNG